MGLSLDACRLHPLKALSVGDVDLRHRVPVLLELRLQLRSVQHAIASSRLDHLGLLFDREVLPGEVRPDDLLEEGQNLVVADSAGVGEVVDPRLALLCHHDRRWQEIGQDRVAVGNVDDSLVFANLGDKVARVQVIRDWHAQAEDQTVGIILHDLQVYG